MSRSYTERYPGRHFGKVKIWSPSPDAMSHTSVQVFSGMQPEIADLITVLMIHGNRLNRRALDQLGYMAKSLREVVHNEREDRSP